MSVIKHIQLEDISGALTELADIGAKAENVEFDNSDSGLEATNIQDAIVEITESGITGLKYTVDGDSDTYATIQNATEDGILKGLPFIKNVATGYFSHAEGTGTSAIGMGSHTEGRITLANKQYAHAEGQGTTASGMHSHTEGIWTLTSGECSHAEGGGHIDFDTREVIPVAALGAWSHAEGGSTTARGECTHSEGVGTVAFGNNSHAQNNHTMAQGQDQTVIGKYNIAQGNPTSASNTDYAFIIGNGTNVTPSNAFAVQWNGAMSQDNGETTFKFTKDLNGNKGYIDENGNFNTFGNSSTDLPWITPQDYGAKGDGVTDDTTAIQATFDAVNTAGGGTVFFPKGIYKIVPTTTLKVYSNTTILGDKGESIIAVDPEFQLSTAMIGIGSSSSSATNVHVRGITFRGVENYGSAQSGLRFVEIWQSTNVSFVDCLFQNNMNAAIKLVNSSNIQVFDSRFEAVDCGIIAQGTDPVNDVTIRGCHFTGVSSLNNFTNFNSENISLFCGEAASEPNKRWRIEDCIFEHKATTAILIGVHGEVAGGDHIANKDIIVRNCTFGGMLAAVTIVESEDVLLDGLFFDDTPKIMTSHNINTLIKFRGSKNCIAKNIVSRCTQFAFTLIHFEDAYNSDITIDDFDAIVPYNASNVTNSVIFASNSDNTVKNRNITIKNAILRDNINNGNRASYIQCANLENSYIDIKPYDSTLDMAFYLPSASVGTVINNKFIINTENNVRRSWGTAASKSVADTNKWILIGNGVYNNGYLPTSVNQSRIPKTYNITIANETHYNSSLAVTDFYLMNDGYDFYIDFVASSYTAGKTFTFNKTGNIIPIDQPFTFSNDYKVVCHFVQKNAKWVEVERTLEYYDDINVNTINDFQYVTPKMFGAVGDGTTDDTDAILAMFASGKNVFLNEGTYLVNKQIVIRNNIIVDGAGAQKAVIKADQNFDYTGTNTPLFFYSISNVTIKNIGIVMEYDLSLPYHGGEMTLVGASKATTVVIDSCWFKALRPDNGATKGTNLVWGRGTKVFEVRNCLLQNFTNAKTSGCLWWYNWSDVAVDGNNSIFGDRIIFDNNIVEHTCWDEAIGVWTSNDTTRPVWKNVQITNNHIIHDSFVENVEAYTSDNLIAVNANSAQAAWNPYTVTIRNNTLTSRYDCRCFIKASCLIGGVDIQDNNIVDASTVRNSYYTNKQIRIFLINSCFNAQVINNSVISSAPRLDNFNPIIVFNGHVTVKDNTIITLDGYFSFNFQTSLVEHYEEQFGASIKRIVGNAIATPNFSIYPSVGVRNTIIFEDNDVNNFTSALVYISGFKNIDWYIKRNRFKANSYMRSAITIDSGSFHFIDNINYIVRVFESKITSKWDELEFRGTQQTLEVSSAEGTTPYTELTDTILYGLANVVTVYRTDGVNVDFIHDKNLLQLPDGEFSINNVNLSIKDNVITLNTTDATTKKIYIKLTNEIALNEDTAPTSWRSETVSFMKSGKTYGIRDFSFGGTAKDKGMVASVRDSSGTTILSRSRTNPVQISASPAYIQLFIESGSSFVDYKVGVAITENEIPKDWGNIVAYKDYWKQYISQCFLDTENFINIEPVTGYVIQGMCTDGTYLYTCLVDGSSDASNTYVYKYNLADGSLVTSVNSYSLGHCNSMTCIPGGYILCIALDNAGTIHVINASDLSYVSSFTVDLSDVYSAYTGIGAISYNASRDVFICLIRGSRKGYAILDRNGDLLDLVWTRKFYNDSTARTAVTYGSCFADDNFIYQITYNYNGVQVFTYNGDYVGNIILPAAMYNNEPEDISIDGENMYINIQQSGSPHVAKLAIHDKRYACVLKR